MLVSVPVMKNPFAMIPPVICLTAENNI
jgi:hypothetical protein